MRKVHLAAILILIIGSTSARAISLGDISDGWDHATGEITNFFEKLKNDIKRLGDRIKGLTSEIEDIRIRTPKIDFKDISGRLKIPKERFNFPEWRNFDRLGSSLENFKIGGEVGKIAQAIKYHWGPEISKCLKDNHWLNACRYSVCKVDKSLTWADDENKEHWQCELKIVELEQQQLQTELDENLGAIGAGLDTKKERLSEKIKPFAD